MIANHTHTLQPITVNELRDTVEYLVETTDQIEEALEDGLSSHSQSYEDHLRTEDEDNVPALEDIPGCEELIRLGPCQEQLESAVTRLGQLQEKLETTPPENLDALVRIEEEIDQVTSNLREIASVINDTTPANIQV